MQNILYSAIRRIDLFTTFPNLSHGRKAANKRILSHRDELMVI